MTIPSPRERATDKANEMRDQIKNLSAVMQNHTTDVTTAIDKVSSDMQQLITAMEHLGAAFLEFKGMIVNPNPAAACPAEGPGKDICCFLYLFIVGPDTMQSFAEVVDVKKN